MERDQEIGHVHHLPRFDCFSAEPISPCSGCLEVGGDIVGERSTVVVRDSVCLMVIDMRNAETLTPEDIGTGQTHAVSLVPAPYHLNTITFSHMLYVYSCKKPVIWVIDRLSQRMPQGKKRTALLGKLKVIFRRHRLLPIHETIEQMNPILRGWVNYFAVGHSSLCFSFIRNHVDKGIQRHLARARQRQGFGWKRWSRSWLYSTLGLFNE